VEFLFLFVPDLYKVTVTSGMVSREDLDDLLREFYADQPEAFALLVIINFYAVKMIHYIPTKTILELVQVCVSSTI
jgi:hypothetical protein